MENQNDKIEEIAVETLEQLQIEEDGAPRVYTAVLNGSIKDFEDVEEINLCLASAREQDTIHLKICSDGGDLTVATTLYTEMEHCKATIVTEITGVCYSAATTIFLKGDKHIINKGVAFMTHTSAFGYDDYCNNMKDFTDFTNKLTSQWLDDTYKGFLTTAEIKRVKQGKHYWMDYAEVKKRLENAGREIITRKDIEAKKD